MDEDDILQDGLQTGNYSPVAWNSCNCSLVVATQTDKRNKEGGLMCKHQSADNVGQGQADLGHSHQARNDPVYVSTAVGECLFDAVCIVSLKRLIQGLELQRCLLLCQLQCKSKPSTAYQVGCAQHSVDNFELAHSAALSRH